ncbi:hypothetical protein E0Z10_g4997 [Xylaria hypoxylon]|uniref:Uncharacterized protein n=1 Tax=Xylaria hypoxylon TaxID=37992 RepID=A0A4Z0Z592_9PEZI|nr:hypothetical protein E0Z10_g4997 [Xylaria hypoxylon]
MFILPFFVAGYLLVLSAASPAQPYPVSTQTTSTYFVDPTSDPFTKPTPPKQFTRPTPKQFTKPTVKHFTKPTPTSKATPTYPIASVPTYIVTPAPTRKSTPLTYPYSSLDPLPGSCYTTFEDYKYTGATVKTHPCYTQTSLFPAAQAPCPTLSCRPIPTDLVCPQYIKVSSLTVPCATNCCPTTSTVYSADYSAPCPTCDPCRIPTEWITYTTGCVGTPTITEVNVITPAYPMAYPV